MPGAPGIPRAHLASPGAPEIFTGASGVIEVHLQSTGAPWEWQVRPVSNKRMPGAPGNPQVHLGNLQVHLMRTLLVKARLSGRYLTTGVLKSSQNCNHLLVHATRRCLICFRNLIRFLTPLQEDFDGLADSTALRPRQILMSIHEDRSERSWSIRVSILSNQNPKSELTISP
jgi:hypothetical protein